MFFTLKKTLFFSNKTRLLRIFQNFQKNFAPLDRQPKKKEIFRETFKSCSKILFFEKFWKIRYSFFLSFCFLKVWFLLSVFQLFFCCVKNGSFFWFLKQLNVCFCLRNKQNKTHAFLNLACELHLLPDSSCSGSIGSRTTTSAGILFQHEWEFWNRFLPRPASFQHDTAVRICMVHEKIDSWKKVPIINNQTLHK